MGRQSGVRGGLGGQGGSGVGGWGYTHSLFSLGISEHESSDGIDISHFHGSPVTNNHHMMSSSNMQGIL